MARHGSSEMEGRGVALLQADESGTGREQRSTSGAIQWEASTFADSRIGTWKVSESEDEFL